MSNCSLISHYSNKFYESNSNRLKDRSYSNEMMSSESLTSVTIISKHEQTGLIYQAKSNRKRNYKLKPNFNEYSKTKSVSLSKRKYKVRNKQKYISGTNNTFNRRSNVNFRNINTQQPLSVVSSIFHETKQENFKESKGKIQVLSYKFWIDANCKNWNIFHNPVDRRIESIGRLAKCKIQLTNIIARHSDGMLKQQVIIYTPDQSSLEKCCKLFDDKFPSFYATSGLTRILYLY